MAGAPNRSLQLTQVDFTPNPKTIYTRFAYETYMTSPVQFVGLQELPEQSQRIAQQISEKHLAKLDRLFTDSSEIKVHFKQIRKELLKTAEIIRRSSRLRRPRPG